MGYEVDATCPSCRAVEWVRSGWLVNPGRGGRPVAHEWPTQTEPDWTCNVCEHRVRRPSPKGDLLDSLVTRAQSRSRGG